MSDSESDYFSDLEIEVVDTIRYLPDSGFDSNDGYSTDEYVPIRQIDNPRPQIVRRLRRGTHKRIIYEFLI